MSDFSGSARSELFRLRDVCAQRDQQVLRLLDLLEEVRQQGVRETDGWFTLSPDVVEAMIEVTEDIRAERGGSSKADEWP